MSFELEVTSQGWLESPTWDAAREDLCSHGDLRLVIGGRVIAAGDGSGDYTISRARSPSCVRSSRTTHGATRSPRAPS